MKRHLLAACLLALVVALPGCATGDLGTWFWPSRASQPVQFAPTSFGTGRPVFERVSRDGRFDDSLSREAYGVPHDEPWDLR